MSAPAADGVRPVARTADGYPVSFAQEGLLLADQLAGGDPSYNIPWCLRLEGSLDVAALTTALRTLVGRHEALRTSYEWTGTSFRQVVAHPDGTFLDVPVTDVDGEATAEREAVALLREPFDLTGGPPLRARLLRVADDEHVLVFSVHHIAFDGWSLRLFGAELGEAYAAALAARPLRLPDPGPQYVDYAVWQRNLPDRHLDASLRWWRERLGGAATVNLPLDHPRAPTPRHRGGVLPFTIPAAVAADLRRLARAARTSDYVVLLAAFLVLLHRYSGQTDLSVGTPVANRDVDGLDEVVGFFVNTLVLRVDLAGDPSFTELVDRVRAVVTESMRHQEAPFERVVAEVNPRRDPSSTPLFQVLFGMGLPETPPAAWAASGLRARPLGWTHGLVKFDLTITVNPRRDGSVDGLWQYDADLFEASTARTMAEQFVHLATGLADDATAPVSRTPLRGPAEPDRPGADVTAEDLDVTVHELILAQARRTPTAVAVAQGDARISYRELDRRSAALAASFEAGQEIIGLCLPRCPDSIVALLGILRSGAAFLPLDPELPAERLRLMVEDAGVRTVVVHDPAVVAGLDVETITLDALPDAARPVPAPGRADGLCYVIYTSGSTGRPKGVAIEHRSLVHYVRSLGEVLGAAGIDPSGASFATVSTLAADLGHTSVFGALLNGGCVHVLDYGTVTDPYRFSSYLGQYRVDILKIVPTHFDALRRGAATPEAVTPRRALIFGGETLTTRLAEAVAAQPGAPAVFNHYGPTETCVGALMGRFTVDGDAAATVPIGRPLGATRIAVLDPAGRPVPPGATGVLHIGGPGLARGYLGRPDLTERAFVALPDGRYYRTGDQVRVRPAGDLEFVGRADDQVKIRGYRVEPAEVQAVLDGMPGVAQCAVLPVRSGDETTALAAYLVPTPGTDGEALGPRLADALREVLPAVLIPAFFVAVPELPRTRNGKVDRARLPVPPTDAAPVSTAPVSPEEQSLLAVWTDLLGRPVTDPDQDFFAAGGNSLQLMRLVGRIRDTLGVTLSVRDCFTAPSVRAMAARLTATGAPTGPAQVVRTVPRTPHGRYPLSFAQERLWVLDRITGTSTAYNVPWCLRLHGEPRIPDLLRALRSVVDRHEVLRTRYVSTPDGPRQVIQPPGGAFPDLPVVRVRDEAAAEEEAREFLRRPFRLDEQPPIRAMLLRLSAREHVLVVCVHHIAVDGWSVGILDRHLARAYLDAREGRPLAGDPAGHQYADYARWQRDRDAGQLDDSVRWWKRQLTGLQPLRMPFDRPRPADVDRPARTIAFDLPADAARALRHAARTHGTSPFVACLTVFLVLLHRYSGQQDIAVGTPVANRDRAEFDEVVGFFVNTLVLRATVTGDDTFGTLLERVHGVLADALTHRDAPFERIVTEVNPVRDVGRTPLFQVMFGMELPGVRDSRWTAGDLRAETLRWSHETAKYDLSVSVEDHPDGSLTGTWQYDTALVGDATASAMVGHFRHLAATLAGDLTCPVARARMLDDVAWDRMVRAENDTGTSVPDAQASVGELILRAARSHPGAPALRQGRREISYRELDDWSGSVAAQLRPGPGLVGILMPRVPENIVALLAVLRVGAAYVPLDPTLPPARLRFIIEDAGIDTLLLDAPDLDQRLRPAVDGLDVRLVDVRAAADGPRAAVSTPGPGGDALCYVIYTSGTTGRPKGVLAHHRGVLNYLSWACREYGLTAGSRVLLHSPLTFDLSVTTTLAPLTVGAVIEMTAGDDLDGLITALRDTAAPYQLVKLTPAHLRVLNVALAAELEQRTLTRCLVVGGEALPSERVRPWRRSRVINEYGPTETVVGCTAHEVTDGDGEGDVPIGRPIANTANHVLDRYRQPAPVGVPGELWVGGMGVTLGYLNRPGLTAERFTPDPFVPGARLYRTGDLAVRDTDGLLHYLGRTDDQVKIRGYRVELAEVENTLRTLPGVLDAAVVHDRHRDVLLGYVVAPGQDTEDIPGALRAILPEYMVPAGVQALRRLPLTANGKLDRAALPRTPSVVAPSAPVPGNAGAEEIVLRLWAELLGRTDLGRHENFFDVGGHSLLLVQLHARLTRAFHTDVALLDLFRNPTAAAMAALMRPSSTPQGPVAASAPLNTDRRQDRANALNSLRRRRNGA
ncbi:hypothetical protein C6361_01765 [Plantactinospora sp. BC1]|uniref:non-ribosomal peptide synthetase n=1 Tax=Plantactinospora sp. BC1 TaxID=2108470 RepID=UPI000D157255|nr:non-ribosomal peptide synthetase [Plantactinospora sp. BC1]AVT28435.1 hypothetical protein C6361_01765 [Plantactinospora sp. BC1]